MADEIFHAAIGTVVPMRLLEQGREIVRVSRDGVVSLPDGMTWAEAWDKARAMTGNYRGVAMALLNLYAFEHLSRVRNAPTS